MLQIKRKLGPKGQIVLPQDIRHHLGLKTGMEVTFITQDHEVILKLTSDPLQSVEDFCSVGRLKKNISPKEWKKILGEQYEERAKKMKI